MKFVPQNWNRLLMHPILIDTHYSPNLILNTRKLSTSHSCSLGRLESIYALWCFLSIPLDYSSDSSGSTLTLTIIIIHLPAPPASSNGTTIRSTWFRWNISDDLVTCKGSNVLHRTWWLALALLCVIFVVLCCVCVVCYHLVSSVSFSVVFF